MGKFPDFIIIGAMKCGTTVLWRNLNKHPDINMGKNPEDPKKTSTEIRFWNNGQPYHTWSKGLSWYKSLFSGKVSGEKCANYIESRDTLKLIAKHIPGVKIIMGIREPVARAYSEWQMQRGPGPEEKFLRDFNNNKGYYERGCYMSQIDCGMRTFFKDKNIYIYVQEKMQQDTNTELNKIYKFLGVSEFNGEVKGVSFNDRDVKLDSYRVWKTKYTPLSKKLKDKLKLAYKGEVGMLFNYLGYKIKEWE